MAKTKILKKGVERMPRTKRWIKEKKKPYEVIIKRDDNYYKYQQQQVILFDGKRTTTRKYIGTANAKEYHEYRKKIRKKKGNLSFGEKIQSFIDKISNDMSLF
jgi:hypothetical protein